MVLDLYAYFVQYIQLIDEFYYLRLPTGIINRYMQGTYLIDSQHVL